MPLPRAADRAQEQAVDGAHGREGHDGGTMLGDRRHVGPARRERPHGEARCQAPDGPRAGSRGRARRRRLPPREHGDQRGDRSHAVAPDAGARPRLWHRGGTGRTGMARRRWPMRKLTVDDIVDHRAYERERDDLRRRVIEVKRRRRIPLGELVTIVFENVDTMRFQVQEMARAERMLTDEAIGHEVATYNELIPDPGELSGTLFIELTDDAALREWLPKLRDIEFAVRFDLRPRDGDESR